MDAVQELEHRITELEIQSALQEDVIAGLNAMVAELRQTLDLQQAQLRLLYQKNAGQESRRARAVFPARRDSAALLMRRRIRISLKKLCLNIPPMRL